MNESIIFYLVKYDLQTDASIQYKPVISLPV